MAKKQTQPDVPEILPPGGGSYTRHPDTGELTRVEGTKRHREEDVEQPQQSAVQQPTTIQE